MSSQFTLPAWFAHAIEALQAGNIDDWMKIYSSDAVHEFPFAGGGGVRRLDGREAIRNYMINLPAMIRFGALRDICVREVGDELIIEATGHHHKVLDNAPIDLSYVWFISRHNGLVTHIRDYMNPLQLAAM